MTELWRHTKTGGLYRFVAHALREADLAPMVVYAATDTAARIWVRPAGEFYDRFTRLPSNGPQREPAPRDLPTVTELDGDEAQEVRDSLFGDLT